METDSQISKKTQNIRKNSAGLMLKKISTRFDKAMVEKLKILDLNLGQFAVLMTLLEEEGLTQAGIGEKISMPGYATTRTIDALEEQKLVERRIDKKSRRNRLIYLTKNGKALAPHLFKIVKDVNENLLFCLSKDERNQFKEVIEKILTFG